MSAHRRSPSTAASRYHPFTTVRRILGHLAGASRLSVNDDTGRSDGTSVIENSLSEDETSSHMARTADSEVEKGGMGSEVDTGIVGSEGEGENEGEDSKSTREGEEDNSEGGDDDESEGGEETLGSDGSGELEKELGFESSSEPEVIAPTGCPHSTEGNPLDQQSVIVIDHEPHANRSGARDDETDEGGRDASDSHPTVERLPSVSRSSRSRPLSSLDTPTGQAVVESIVPLPPFELLSALNHAEYDPHAVASEKCNQWLANPPPELEEGEILEVVELTTTTNSFSDAPTELVFGSVARGVHGYDFSTKTFMGGRLQYSPPLPGPSSQNRWVFLPDHTYSTAALVRSIGDIDFTPKPLGGRGFTYFVFSELENEPLEYCWSLAKIGDPHPVFVRYRLTHAPNCAPVWTYQN